MNRNEPYYVGLDIPKKIVVACVKESNGRIVDEVKLPARRADLCNWASALDRPWIGGMEATLFTGWIYDALLPIAQELKVGNPLMMKAIGASKKKNDALDARKIADMVRCDLLPECYMAPQEIRELRQALRFRNFLVRICVQLKNKSAGLLMESGAEYNKKKLHGKKYFQELLGNLEDIPFSVKQMLRFNHEMLNTFEQNQKRLLTQLQSHRVLAERVRRLQTIPGVGQVLSLAWALEIGDPHRFSSISKAISYCGLCSGQNESAGKAKRGPISKQRNPHIQWVLIETAKLAPRWNTQLAKVREKAEQEGHKNRATLQVARKLTAYLMAVDKSEKDFELRE